MSQIRFSGALFLSKSCTWPGSVGFGSSFFRGTLIFDSGEYSDGLTICRIAPNSRLRVSPQIVRLTIFAFFLETGCVVGLSSAS